MSGFLYSPVMESGGYQIANSLRLRASASAYFYSTTVAGSQVAATYPLWVKRGTLGARQAIFGCERSAGADGLNLEFDSSDRLRLGLNLAGGTTAGELITSQQFRDPSAHLHVVAVFDTANATASDRLRLYVNGARVTAFSTATYPALNATVWTGVAGLLHYFGRFASVLGSFHFDGLLSEPRVVGQALDPSYFGQFNSDGVWVPKAYTGTYGTNGFYLPFNDGSNLTNLCLDSSGNGNHWTASGVSLTAGPTYDWMVDTPTNNYAVLNALNPWPTGVNYSEGNLKLAIGAPAGGKSIRTTMPFPSAGKAYLEFLSDNGSDASTGIGFGFMVGSAWYYLYASSAAAFYANGSTQATGMALIGGGITYQLALDAATGKAWIGRNNVWYNSTGGTTGDPSTGANPTFTLPAGECFPFIYGDVTTTITFKANFGQRPFAYTPPTGFKALCTANRGVGSITTSGTFTGNANADGPFVWLNGNPESLTINGNAVTWGTHADKTAGGFKIRTASASYNTSGTNTYTVTTTGKLFGDLAHAPNTAKGNP